MILSRSYDCTKSACVSAPLHPSLFPSRFAHHPFYFSFDANSETHGRSCKKIKEKTICSVGGSFSRVDRGAWRTRLADVHTYTHTHTRAQHTYGLRLGFATVSVCVTLLFFSFFNFLIESLSRTKASTAPSSDLHSRFGRSTKRSLSFYVSIYQAPILAR